MRHYQRRTLKTYVLYPGTGLAVLKKLIKNKLTAVSQGNSLKVVIKDKKFFADLIPRAFIITFAAFI